ncbi:MAG TPA: BON domain-containing protein [Steroidobacter sp.]
MTIPARLILVASLSAVSVVSYAAPAAHGADGKASEVGRVIDDSVITSKVKAALVADSVTKAHQINVETRQGEVLLSGFVDSKEARSRAADLARKVEGVHAVKNSLELRSAS